MPILETLRLRRPLSEALRSPLALASAPSAPIFPEGADGERPPLVVDLTLSLLPLFNGKPTRNLFTTNFLAAESVAQKTVLSRHLCKKKNWYI